MRSDVGLIADEYSRLQPPAHPAQDPAPRLHQLLKHPRHNFPHQGAYRRRPREESQARREHSQDMHWLRHVCPIPSDRRLGLGHRLLFFSIRKVLPISLLLV